MPVKIEFFCRRPFVCKTGYKASSYRDSLSACGERRIPSAKQQRDNAPCHKVLQGGRHCHSFSSRPCQWTYIDCESRRATTSPLWSLTIVLSLQPMDIPDFMGLPDMADLPIYTVASRTSVTSSWTSGDGLHDPEPSD
jgi:hypothetical protein